MNKTIKNILTIACAFTACNVFAEQQDLSSKITLSPNAEGYKLKYIDNLSNLPIIDATWYPSYYEMNNKIRINDKDSISFSHRIVVNNGYIYRLQHYMMYDKYTKQLSNSENQLRLCREKIGSKSQWDCSIVLDSSSSDTPYYDAVLSYSPDGDNIAGLYKNSDSQQYAFEFDPKTLKVTKTYLPSGLNFRFVEEGSDSRIGYYMNREFYGYSVTEKINLATKQNFVYKPNFDFGYYSSDHSCRYDGAKFYLADKIFTARNGRLFRVSGDYQTGYTVGEQLGELNGQLGELNGQLQSGSAHKIWLTGGNVYSIKNVPYEGGNFIIYYNSITADKNQKWKILQFTSSAKSPIYMGYDNGIVPNQNKLYVVVSGTDGYQFANTKVYLYEISK